MLLNFLIIKLQYTNLIKKQNNIKKIFICCYKYLFVLYKKIKKVLKNKNAFDIINLSLVNGDVAQLARASGSYPEGRGFNSLRRYQMNVSSGIFPSFYFTFSLFFYDNVVKLNCRFIAL